MGPMLMALFGGMALLLYGMRLAGEGLQRAAGGRLKSVLTTLTSNRLSAVAVGALVTATIQSSSATTVMLIGFVSAGLMTLQQSMGVILGADIGTTFTVQLLAFKIFDYAILLVGLGFAVIFSSRRRVMKDLGEALLGFGFIFLGLKIMIDGMEPLQSSPLARENILVLSENPLLGIIAAALFSALVHSSAATIGLALALASQGLMPLSGAIPVVLGANIGTCATALASSLGTSSEARRVAVAHVAFKVLGAALVFPFISPFESLVVGTATDLPRQIANAHTLFNIGISVIFLPFAGLAARLLTGWIPEEVKVGDPFHTRYLDERFLETPSLALGQATREALRMADVVQTMVRDALPVFQKDDQELLESVERRDDQVDYFEREIKLYLTKLSQDTMTSDLARRQIALLSFISNLENIGDIVDKNLMDQARKKIFQVRHFSDAGSKELEEFHGLITQSLVKSIAAFATGDRTLAQEVLDEKSVIRQRERELRASHLERLRVGLAESLESSEIHLDVLTNLKRINSHITSIIYPILEA